MDLEQKTAEEGSKAFQMFTQWLRAVGQEKASQSNFIEGDKIHLDIKMLVF